ncbi:MAG: flagellar hook-basal body complex protein FliE [Beijerinckiaceae bacterium]
MVTSAFAAGAYASQAGGAGASLLKTASAATGSQPGAFGDALQNVLKSTLDSAKKGDAASMQAVQGKANLVDVVTAVTESEAAIETLVAVRDRVIAAYEEIMRMPI